MISKSIIKCPECGFKKDEIFVGSEITERR